MGGAVRGSHTRTNGDSVKFEATALKGAYIIKPELITDTRGLFARTFCRNEFQKQGLASDLVQCNISFNRKRGTLRGMHYQADPYSEAKLVRCTMGAIYDVVVDISPDSPTFRKWVGVELSAQNRVMLYIPEGYAHGFQTLKEDTEVFYQMSEFYHPEKAAGVRWNDPALAIDWPVPNPIVSEKDSSYSYID